MSFYLGHPSISRRDTSRSTQRNGENARATLPDKQMRSETSFYPVDRYLVESSKKIEMVNIIDDAIWNPDPALKPEEEMMLRKLHDMLQSTADDLKLLSGELTKFHEPGVQVKSLPMPLDEEFNERVHIEEVVNARFHGYKIIDKSSTHSPASKPKNDSIDEFKLLASNFKPKVINTGTQVNTTPILKKPVVNKKLGISHTKTLQINETRKPESVKQNNLNNSKIANNAPKVTYNEIVYKYIEPKVKNPQKSLQIQEMPCINIRSEFKEQKVLQLDIVPEVKDNRENVKSKTNVAVIALQHETTPMLKQMTTLDYGQSFQSRIQSDEIKKHPTRKVSKISTYDSSESTNNNTSSDIRHKLKTQKQIRTVIKNSPKSSKGIERNRNIKHTTNYTKVDSNRRHINIDEWNRKLNNIYGQPSSSRKTVSKAKENAKKASPKNTPLTKLTKLHARVLNNAEYIPYSQLTLGGARVSDIEREISDVPNKNDMPLSPILDKIINSRENSFHCDSPRKHRKKDSTKILTTSDENLLQEVIDIERTVTKTLSKNLKKNVKKSPDQLQDVSNISNDDNNDSYADDFEDEKSDHLYNETHTNNEKSEEDASRKSDNEDNGDSSYVGEVKTKGGQNTTYTKISNLTMKNSVDIFEFLHSIDTQDTATQSNTTNKISLKETQTSPRNDTTNLQPIHNELWPSIDPRGQVEKIFQLEKDFIKKLIIDEYGDTLEKNITKPSTSKQGIDREKNVTALQKNTQISPKHVKSIMTSPTKTKTRTTSPFTMSLTVDHQTSPLIFVTNEEEIKVDIDNASEDHAISVNLSSPRFSLRLPQTSRDVLSNLEVSNQTNDENKVNSNDEKSKTYRKNIISSTSSVDGDNSSSEISSLGEIKLKRKLRKIRIKTSESSTSSAISKYSSDFNSVGMLPLRSEGEVSLGERVKKTNKFAFSDGEMNFEV